MDNRTKFARIGHTFLAFGVASLTLSGCAITAAPPQDASVSAPEAAASSSLSEAYTLDIGDRVRISTFNEPSLSGEFQVGGNGTISFPLIGEVPAQNQTSKQLEAALVARLASGYLKDPRVTVEALSFRPFFILGEVNRPGQYPTFDGMTVSRAIALAGGYTYRANRKYVQLRHRGQTQEQKVTVESDVKVLPGDVLRIGERYF